MEGTVTTESFRLLDLPAEIRLRICVFALSSHKEVWVCKSKPTIAAITPALCRASSLVRRESVPLFFDLSSITLDTSTSVMRERSLSWLDIFTPYLGYIKDLSVLGELQVRYLDMYVQYGVYVETSKGHPGYRTGLFVQKKDLVIEEVRLRKPKIELTVQQFVSTFVAANDGELKWSKESAAQLMKELVFVGTGT